jgi:uncharacterized protein YxeA
MLSQLVGPVDFSAAIVLIALAICICIIVTSLIVRQNKTDVENAYALAKMRQQAENDRAMFQVETDRAYKIKQLESNLITSHARHGDE